MAKKSPFGERRVFLWMIKILIIAFIVTAQSINPYQRSLLPTFEQATINDCMVLNWFPSGERFWQKSVGVVCSLELDKTTDCC